MWVVMGFVWVVSNKYFMETGPGGHHERFDGTVGTTGKGFDAMA